MSNYTKSTNFATKDNLSPGNPLKIVKGTEIDTEFNNIQTAVATKTDNASAAITGGSITGITDLAVADGGTGASTATAALNNLLPSQTGNANKYLQTDGTNATWDAVSLSTADITGTLGVANGGTGVTSSTGSGSVVLSNSPTLVTPALGTPASGVATNLTGLPISTGVSGLGTGVATFLGTPSSANLISAVTDETGTGSLVFATSPTLVTPDLGTPSSATLTNATGLPISTGVSGLGTNVATFLGTPSSANLASAVSDETGSGALVFANSPSLVTPTLGTPASATLTNATGLPISTGVSGLGTGVASFLATPSSANLATAVSDETGSGALVFANSPTLVTPALGTPSSATLTNATGLPISSGVSGLGTGVATFLATPSSANLASAVTDETGTGALVFANSPTLVTPALGTPASGVATNLTGLPLSTGVTGTLPVANGGTGQTSYTDGQLLIGNSTGNTLTKATLTAGSGISVTNAGGSITIAATGGGGSGDVVGPTSATDNAFTRFDGTTGKLLQNSTGATLSDTGGATFTGSVDVAGTSTAGSNIKLYEDTDNGTNYVSFKAPDTIAANVTWTLPSADGTSSQVLSTNGTGTLSWATVSGGGSAATPTALGTVYGSMTTSGASPYLTALGYQAANANTSGAYNVAVGTNALLLNTTGQQNVAIGYGAIDANTTGQYNVGIGQNALGSNTTAQVNTAVGWNSAAANTTGESNTSLGAYSLYSNTTASNNTAVGYQAGYSNTTGNVTAFGQGSLYSNVTGDGNSAFGVSSLTANTGNYNSAFGWRSGYSNTSGTQNAFVGYATGYANTTGGYNTAMGNTAMYTNTTGSYNTAIGVDALRLNTTSLNNTAVGYGALYSMTTTGTGNNNVAVGYNAGYSNTGGSSVFIGYNAGGSCTAANNIFIGLNAGATNGINVTTGTNNVVVGNAVSLAAATNSNSVVIGDNVNGKGSNTGFISPGGGGVYQGNNSSSWSTTSDQRLKKNIADNNDGLDKINSIRVRNFEYRLPDEVDAELKPADAINKTGVQLGVIAQELQAVLPECVKQESTGVLSVDTDNLTWYLINAVKELSARVKQLEGN